MAAAHALVCAAAHHDVYSCFHGCGCPRLRLWPSGALRIMAASRVLVRVATVCCVSHPTALCCWLRRPMPLCTRLAGGGGSRPDVRGCSSLWLEPHVRGHSWLRLGPIGARLLPSCARLLTRHHIGGGCLLPLVSDCGWRRTTLHVTAVCHLLRAATHRCGSCAGGRCYWLLWVVPLGCTKTRRCGCRLLRLVACCAGLLTVVAHALVYAAS